jgi:hypothetical protein
MKDWALPSDTGRDESGNPLQGYRCQSCHHRIELVVDSPVATPMQAASASGQIVSPLAEFKTGH